MISVTPHKCLAQQAYQSTQERIQDADTAEKKNANVKELKKKV